MIVWTQDLLKGTMLCVRKGATVFKERLLLATAAPALVLMKHYKKILVIKHFIRIASSILFVFLLSALQVHNANTSTVIDFL